MATTSPQTRNAGNTGAVRSNGRSERRFTETKAFFKTSEFMVWAATVIGVLVVTYLDDEGSLSNWHGWLLISVLSAAYMFSRGLAKSGSQEPYRDEH